MAMNHVKIFDTTLRDGEQSPGCSMNLEEKLKVAAQLEALGVDIIEAGFAIASEGDFQAVSEVARQCQRATVASLSRAAEADISRAWAAVKHARAPRIHTFIATSPLHMRVKLRMEPTDVLEAIRKSVSHARNLCPDVEWSAEDATRSDPDFLCRAVEIAIAAGATTINLPDTVGYATPESYAAMFSDVIARVPGRTGPPSPRTATTIWALRSPTPWRPSLRARARSSRPSTGSASAPATPRWRRW
ncbi:hypothetical protein [Hankyongella ginsenosidimutans]|uniref:hypothetical protein n=1 Tax=Hankyongella ginsenosidimutans TaxID=1763828 RepID=UPI0024831E4B|nr:hypothetical protein [Hankyongella ginsenosidimutans]